MFVCLCVFVCVCVGLLKDIDAVDRSSQATSKRDLCFCLETWGLFLNILLLLLFPFPSSSSSSAVFSSSSNNGNGKDRMYCIVGHQGGPCNGMRGL